MKQVTTRAGEQVFVRSRLGRACLALIGACAFWHAGAAVAQEIGGFQSVTLMGGQREVKMIETGEQSVTFEVPYFQYQSEVLVTVQSDEILNLTIWDPDDDVVYAGALSLNDNGSMTSLLLPTATGSYQYVKWIPVSGAGTLQIEVDRAAVVGDVGVIFTANSDNDALKSALIPMVDELLGGTVGLSMFVFEDGVPCTNGTVSTLVAWPDGTQETFTLHDDGVNIDPVANDGSYSGVFEATQEGDHLAVATFSGITPSGMPVLNLKSAAGFHVTPGEQQIPDPPIVLDPLPWSIRFEYVDVDGNGKYEQIFLSVHVFLYTDERGLEYRLDMDVTPQLSDGSVGEPFALSLEQNCQLTSNEYRFTMPMANLASYGVTGRLVTGSCTLSAVGTGISAVLHAGGVQSEIIDFAQLEHCPADVNQDWLVTPTDFTVWIAAYTAGLDDPLDLRADVNGDEVVTPTDFTAWIAHYNDGC